MKQVSAKATMRREVVDKIFGTKDAATQATRAIIRARAMGAEVFTVGGVKVSTRRLDSVLLGKKQARSA